MLTMLGQKRRLTARGTRLSHAGMIILRKTPSTIAVRLCRRPVWLVGGERVVNRARAVTLAVIIIHRGEDIDHLPVSPCRQRRIELAAHLGAIDRQPIPGKRWLQQSTLPLMRPVRTGG